MYFTAVASRLIRGQWFHIIMTPAPYAGVGRADTVVSPLRAVRIVSIKSLLLGSDCRI